MNKIEQAKRLLKKAIMLDDAELMAMANEILDEVAPTSPAIIVEPTYDSSINATEKISQEAMRITSELDSEPLKETKRETNFDSFKMKSDDELLRRNGVAVNKIKREIEFVDDGSDKHIETPEIKLADRSKRKPFSKIEQTCQKCGRTVKTHPSHKREWFVCDGCIRK